ncbi:MAG: Aminopeptidase YwaD precursor [Alphaproteobacteria bacterium ADurb.Bin438]|nr:MAG: Aminopeptidase YwaD precursor [Alphaproteobacteria bacterium ADurb.Bin438]
MKKMLIIIKIAVILLSSSFIGYGIFCKDYKALNRYPEISANLKTHVYEISHLIGNRDTKDISKLNKTADYIKSEFEKIGYMVEFQHYNAIVGNGTKRAVKNIIAKRADAHDKDITVLGAHYDTCNNPGADDNTSGVSGLIEIARYMYNDESSKNMEFVAFVNEEPPFFKRQYMGSVVYVKDAIKNKKDIKQAIILEMIGYYKDRYFSQFYPFGLGFFYPNKGNFIAFVGNKESKNLTKNLKEYFDENSPLPSQKLGFDHDLIVGTDYSDHYYFWKTKYAPAIMVTDTSFFRNFNYHQDSDTYDTLDYERMSEVVVGVSEFIKKSSTITKSP